MKKRKKIISGFLFLGFSIFLFLFFAHSVSKDNLLRQKIKNTNEQNIIIHFTHGSVAKKDCPDQRERLGGLWGGHVAIQLDSFIYSFGWRQKPAHLFNSAYYNSEFYEEKISNWRLSTANDKLTSITLPITNSQKEILKQQCLKYTAQTPYDYATFGKRCTFTVYELLIDSKIFKPQSEFQMHAITFYPALFRKVWVEFAEKNQLKIERKDGIDCRTWE